MYSALHIMQWFSHILDVFTPKIKQNFFDFYILWIKTNIAYTRLELIARTKYCTTNTASNWFVTLYYKLLPAVRSSPKLGRRRSSLLFILHIYTWVGGSVCESMPCYKLWVPLGFRPRRLVWRWFYQLFGLVSFVFCFCFYFLPNR